MGKDRSGNIDNNYELGVSPIDRAILYTQEVLRSYDLLKDNRRKLLALAWLAQDLLGSTSTFVAGLAGTHTSPSSLTVNIAAGRIYAQAEADATAYGTLGADTTDVVTLQGYYSGGQVTLSTSGLSSGQSQWALIEASFSQSDGIDADDPTSGVLNFYNSENPQVPLVGPGGDGDPLNTDRQGLALISVVYGTAATTGSEVPPNPSSGAVPLYLIDLAFGQTQITNVEIITAGPNCGVNVPNNYPAAPFIQGLSTLANPRIRLTANTTFYVNQSTGSNSNTGLTAKAAWQTWQYAWNYLIANVDLAGFAVTIQGGSNFTAGLIVALSPLGGGSVTIDGGGFNLSVTNGNAIIFDGNAVPVTVQNFGSIAASGSGANGLGISAIGGGNFTLGPGITFGACGTAHMNVQVGAFGNIINNYTIAGNAGDHFYCHGSGANLFFQPGITITLTGTPSFTNFAHADTLANVTVYGITFSGSATGRRYYVDSNATIYTASGGASYFPGSTAGALGTNGSPIYF